MKKLIILIPLILSGCCATNYSFTSPNGAKVEISNYRIFWTTDSYLATLGTNSASISVNKSSTDSQALAAVAQGVVQGMNAAMK